MNHRHGITTDIRVFAVYLLALGTILIVAPNTLLRCLAIPETRENWIRILGWLVIVLGSLYWRFARSDAQQFFVWSIYSRLSTMVFLAMLVLLHNAAPMLLLLGVLDGAGAWWTYHRWRTSGHRRELP